MTVEEQIESAYRRGFDAGAAELSRALASSSGRAAEPGEALASEAVMEAIELTIKAVDANTKRGKHIDYAGILKLALHRSRKALAAPDEDRA